MGCAAAGGAAAASLIILRKNKKKENTTIKRKKKIVVNKIPCFLINKMNDKQPNLTEQDMEEIEKELEKEK